MYNTVKTLAKETILYSLSNIIVRGCSYCVLLLQMNILMPSQYSIVTEFYGGYIVFGHVIYLLSMDKAYFRFVQKLGPRHIFNAILTILLITSFIFSTSFIIAIPQIAKITNHLSHVRYFYYIAGILTLDTLLTMLYASLRVEKKTATFMLVKCLEALSTIFFTFILLYCPLSLRFIGCLICKCFSTTIRLNALDAVFIANILSNVSALGLIFLRFKRFSLVLEKSTTQVVFGYALTSFFATLFWKINDILPLSLFRKLVPSNFYRMHTKEEILGNFGTSCKLTLFITLGIQAFKFAAEPFFFANADRRDAQRLYSQTMHLFILVSCMALLLLGLNIDWIAKVLIPNALYRNTVDTVPYLAFVQVVFGVYYNFSAAFKLSNNPRYNTWISALGSLIIGAMCLLLIPRWGHWGCVYASISGATAMTLFAYYVGQKCYPIPYCKQGFTLLAITFLILGKVSLWPARLAFLGLGWAYVILNIAIVATFCLIGIAAQRRFKQFEE